MFLGCFILLFWYYLNFVFRWLWIIYLLINIIDKDVIIIKEFEFYFLVKYIFWIFFFVNDWSFFWNILIIFNFKINII